MMLHGCNYAINGRGILIFVQNNEEETIKTDTLQRDTVIALSILQYQFFPQKGKHTQIYFGKVI